MIVYFRTLIFILFMCSIGFAWRYQYILLYHLSFGVLFVLIGFIALTFVIGFYLKASKNPMLKSIGDVYEFCFQYTAFAQGVFYTTLVFYIVGSANIGEVPLPDFELKFMFEWMYGSNYLTLIIYVPLLCMLVFFQRLTLLGYLIAFFIACIGVGVPIIFFIEEEKLKLLHTSFTGLFNFAFIFSQLLLSISGMYSMMIIPQARKSKRAKDQPV